MPDDENPIDQESVDGGETPTEEPTTEESQEETFPSFRKAYQYRGGFDKFVYDQLKKANDGE